jgi:hypothetical protein
MNKQNAINVLNEAFRANKIPKASLIKNGSVSVDTIKESLKGVKIVCPRVDCLCSKGNKI